MHAIRARARQNWIIRGVRQRWAHVGRHIPYTYAVYSTNQKSVSCPLEHRAFLATLLHEAKAKRVQSEGFILRQNPRELPLLLLARMTPFVQALNLVYCLNSLRLLTAYQISSTVFWILAVQRLNLHVRWKWHQPLAPSRNWVRWMLCGYFWVMPISGDVSRTPTKKS